MDEGMLLAWRYGAELVHVVEVTDGSEGVGNGWHLMRSFGGSHDTPKAEHFLHNFT